MSDIATDPIEMTLALHDYDVPCFMEIQADCPNRAEWLVSVRHEIPADCNEPTLPMCDLHKRLTVPGGFWEHWFEAVGQVTKCDECGIPLKYVAKPLKGEPNV